MITEDKITEFFCISDVFYKIYDAQLVKNAFKFIELSLIYCQFTFQISDKSYIFVSINLLETG